MAREKLSGFAFAAVVVSAILGGCHWFRGAEASVDVDLPSSTGSFLYSLDFGYAPVDVYFVLTNTSLSAENSMPVISRSAGEGAMPEVAAGAAERERGHGSREAVDGASTPWVRELYRSPGLEPDGIRRARRTPAPAPALVVPGSTKVFYLDSLEQEIPSTCRIVVPDISTDYGTRTLCVWVADDCWIDGGTMTHNVTQAIVDAFAGEFLRAGVDNDIYDHVTNVFGEEWGPHEFDFLIPFDGQIHLLLIPEAYGLDGLYDGVSSFLSSSYAYSNECSMLFLNAAAIADPSDTPDDDDLTWSLTDYGPHRMLGIAAHELQHLIHFYQKSVVRKAPSIDRWINEMCSMVAEDLVAYDIGVDGPRGRPYDSPSAGPADITDGLLLEFLATCGGQLNTWDSLGYARVYGFGAYLARNYGGAAMMRDIVQCGSADYTAIEQAAALNGRDDDFPTILRRWGSAVLLSNETEAPVPYRYNNGDSWFIDSLGCHLGSINLYNYTYTSTGRIGPTIYAYLPPGVIPPCSNRFFRAACGVTGTVEWEISLDADTRLTVAWEPAR